MSPIRLIVADDHEIVRRGLCSLLTEQPGWEVIAEASNGKEAVQRVKDRKPDVIILDISMPLLNGLEATRQIIRSDPKARVLILTMHESDPIIQEVLSTGARGYVLKSDASRDLVNAVDALYRNKTYFSSKIGQMVLDGYMKPKPAGKTGLSDLARLTPRQREVVQLLAEGHSTKEVAAALGLSTKTAETHRANIMRRLNCHSVSELVRYAVRNHIVEA